MPPPPRPDTKLGEPAAGWGGEASSGSTGLVQHQPGAGAGHSYHARASHLAKATQRRELPLLPEEGCPKPCSTINGRSSKGLLAGVEIPGTIYCRRGLSLASQAFGDVPDSRTNPLSPLAQPSHPPALSAWGRFSGSAEGGTVPGRPLKELALHDSPPARRRPSCPTKG